MNYLLISSDPIISANRLQKDKIIKELSNEAKKLIKWTDLNNINNNDNNDDAISDNDDNISDESLGIEDCFENLEDDNISVEMEVE